MIAALNGTIIDKFEDSLILDVAGVGYEIFLTASVISGLNTGEEASFKIYTDVKETSISLFGFLSSEERQAFLLVKTVKGVGPKLALAILSELGASGLYSVLANGDITRLCKVSGVGKKTAQRLLVELSEKVSETLEHSKAAYLSVSDNNDPVFEEARLAMGSLGFSNEVISKSLEKAYTEFGSKDADSSKLLKRALSLASTL